MAGETVVTVVGNLTADPEQRDAGGKAVANFTIASTPRTFDRQANEWKDGEALFLRAAAWGDMAEHVVASLAKGSRVIAQGRLKQRSFEKGGEKRTVIELEVDEIGPSLRYATAQVSRRSRGQGGQQQSSGGWGQQAPAQAVQEPQGAGWATQEPGQAWGAPQGGGQGDSTPF